MSKIIYGDVVELRKLYLTELFDLSDVEVTGDFNCGLNDLTSLKGCPHTVGGNFYCGRNNLTNLEGAPKKVINGGFFCRYSNLTSLKGPHTIHNNFWCSNNPLTSLEGMPKRIYGHIYLPLEIKGIFSIEYIRSLSEIRGMIRYIDVGV